MTSQGTVPRGPQHVRLSEGVTFSGRSGYVFAAGAVVAAALTRLALSDFLGDEAPMLLFVLATLTTGLYAGLGPALLATGLGTLAGTLLFVEPFRSARLLPLPSLPHLGVFVVENLAIAVLVARLHRTRLKERAIARDLEESLLRFAAFFNSAPQAVITLDPSLRVTGWNTAAEQIFGWSATEVIGRPNPLVPDADRAEVERLAHDVLAGTEIKGHSANRLRRDGSLVPCYVWASPLRAQDGTQAGIIVTLVDATEQRTLEQQFQQAQKMEAIGQLASGVAHDFNNCLTVVLGYAELAADGLPKDHPTRSDLAEIKGAAEGAASLTRQLLAFGRKQRLQLETRDVRQSVAAAEKILRRLLPATIQLTTRLGDEPLLVRADDAQLQQVLINMAVNAKDAMPSGGHLTIEAQGVELAPAYAARRLDVTPGQYVMLSVSDTGTGMPPAVRDRIFEPFFTTKEHGRGTGLGLAMVHGTVRQMGGTIWVYSEPGRGTVFKLHFPRVDEEGARRPQEEVTTIRGTERVLVVDDDARVRQLVTDTLSRAGYMVTAVAEATEAVRELEHLEQAPDLLLTDIIMPGMLGTELPKLQNHVNRGLYMSGYADQVQLDALIGDGAADFVAKPFTPTVLLQAVRRALDAPQP